MKLNIVEFATGREHPSFCPAINYNEQWVFYPETHPFLIPVMGKQPVVNKPISGMHYKNTFRPSGSHWKNFLGRSGYISNYFELDFKDAAFDKYRIATVTSTKKKASAFFANRTQMIKSGIHAAQASLTIGKYENKISALLISIDGVTVLYFAAPITKWKPTLVFLKEYPQTNTKIAVDIGNLEEIKSKGKCSVIINEVFDYTNPETIQQDILSSTKELIQQNMQDVVMEHHRKELPAFNDKMLLIASNNKDSE